MKITGNIEFTYKIIWHPENVGSTTYARPHIPIAPINASASGTALPVPSHAHRWPKYLGDFEAGQTITFKLKNFTFRYTSNNSGSGDGITDDNGNFTIDDNGVHAGDIITLEIFAHNSAVKTGEYAVVALPYSTAYQFNASTGVVPIHLTNLPQDTTIAFATAALLQDSYQYGLKEFSPWRDTSYIPGKKRNNNFPVGYETTRADNNQIDVLIPGIVPKLPYNNPNPSGNPTIHYTSLPIEFAHEFGHALQFIKSSVIQRARILSKYLQFLGEGTNLSQDIIDILHLKFSNLSTHRTHGFEESTTPFVALIEAFAMFVDAFYRAQRISAPPVGVTLPPGIPAPDALHPAHHQIFFYLYRRNTAPGKTYPRGTTLGGTNYPTTEPAKPPANVTKLGWPNLKSWPSTASMEEVEGAIFSAIFIDYASRGPIGLDFVVTAYIKSEAITLREYVDWIGSRHGRHSPQYRELVNVLGDWNMFTTSSYSLPGGFLGAPIHENVLQRLSDLNINEIPLSSNPKLGDPPGGSIEINWSANSGEIVEIKPVFGGWVRFIADSDYIVPSGTIGGLDSEYREWSVTGRLVITTFGGRLKRDFQKDFLRSSSSLSLLLPNPPDQIIYEPIKLTKEFFTNTLINAALVEFSEGTMPPPPMGDTTSYYRLVSEFIQGTALMQCNVETPLKVVVDTEKKIEKSGVFKEYLWVTSSIRSPLLLIDPFLFWWFDNRPHDLTGFVNPAPMVDESLTNLSEKKYRNTVYYDPLHPSHAVVPLWMLFGGVTSPTTSPATSPAIFDDPGTNPILNNIKNRKQKYIRFKILRWNISHTKTGGHMFARQFPFFQLVVFSHSDSSTIASRIPASGDVYIPFSPGQYTCKVIPRWESPTSTSGTTSVIRISTDASGKVIPRPNDFIRLNITSATLNVYISQIDYDSKLIWDSIALAVTSGDYSTYKTASVVTLGLSAIDVNDVVIPVLFSGTETGYYHSFRAIYGMVLESAGRHKILPEAVLAVMFFSSLYSKFPDTIANAVSFNQNDLIIGPDIGLYNIADIYTDLVNKGYIDGSLIPISVMENQRANTTGLAVGTRTADIRGWNNAIELLAATLHMGLETLTSEYTSLPTSIPPGPCGAKSTAFHFTSPPKLTKEAEILFMIFSSLPKPSSVSKEYMAHYLGCFVDAKLKTLKWNVTDSSGSPRYPTSENDASFSDFENIHYQILIRTAMVLTLIDCGAFYDY